MGHTMAYCRVSSRDQNPQLQLDALHAHGYDQLFGAWQVGVLVLRASNSGSCAGFCRPPGHRGWVSASRRGGLVSVGRTWAVVRAVQEH